MRFGRITGHVVAYNNMLDLTVTLDDGRQIETIRSGHVPIVGSPAADADLGWQADQYTQETIGNELALLGWEVVAVEPSQPAPIGSGISSAYLVRKTGEPL